MQINLIGTHLRESVDAPVTGACTGVEIREPSTLSGAATFGSQRYPIGSQPGRSTTILLLWDEGGGGLMNGRFSLIMMQRDEGRKEWVYSKVLMALARDPGVGQEQRDAADQNFDYMFKVLIIGNSSVGKTSFLFRYADDSFTSAFVSTVGIDFKVKTIYRNDKRVKLQIWVR
ncbi:hypothetical protein AMECASPLE_017915 [Ameca splendens]|uniref:small monomeric GTPase n=1 Tax=Ameca splendens TaxID=208324 RepID=A0ABV1A907_9TELE